MHRIGHAIALSVLATSCVSAQRATPAVPIATEPITRTLLAQHALAEAPGWETRLYLIHYEPGVAAPLHHHPVEGMGYVVHGSFESAFDGEATTIVREGESFTDRALVPHTLFRNVDAREPLEFLITYVVRTGDPVIETP